jgi:phage recombination protein Bet
MTTALVKAPDGQLSSGQILAGLNTVRSVLAPDLNAEELRLFAMVANRSGLDPFARQIYAVKRKGKVTFQTGIDGYRSIAARTGLYDGQDEPEYSAPCGCGDNRPAGHPESATVRVYRKGVTRAIAATAFWHEYVPAQGQSGDGDIMWRKMPRVMLAKVAEALALRKAFPYDSQNRMGIGADVYTADEMAQAGPPQAEPPVRVTLAERVAAKAAEIAPVREPDGSDAEMDSLMDSLGTFVEAREPWTRERLHAAATTPELIKAVGAAFTRIAEGRPAAEIGPDDWHAIAVSAGIEA